MHGVLMNPNERIATEADKKCNETLETLINAKEAAEAQDMEVSPHVARNLLEWS